MTTTEGTPIYDQMAGEGLVPEPFVMPQTPAFAIHGYKQRRRLVAATNKVLTDAGFAPMRKEQP